MKTLATLVLATFGVAGSFATAAVAAPQYRAHYYQPPYVEDDAAPPPVGFIFMRHTPRCEYPNGWSVTDFTRNLNGIPRGGAALLATGCGTFDPLLD